MENTANLNRYLVSLRGAFPDAGLQLRTEAVTPDDAAVRVDALCGACVAIRGCERELQSRDEYLRYLNGLAETLGYEPEQHRERMSELVPNAILAGGAAGALLMAADGADAAETAGMALDVVEHGTDLLDIGEAGATLGVGWLLSRWARSHFAKKNEAKQREIDLTIERAHLRGLLAEALMDANSDERIEATLMRLSRIGSPLAAGGGPP
ncbi:MAG: hypothetical protein FJX72_21760 [Armatimonadetes bacterium]|nr:hypothetical protein [Armatimonadota bacterium]